MSGVFSPSCESSSCRRGTARLVRTEGRWRAHVFSDYLRGEHDVVVWSNEAGEARGYAVYTQQHRQTGPPWGETVLRVIDWVALDGDAQSALLNYLMGHDLVSQIVITVSEDEPMLGGFRGADAPAGTARIVDWDDAAAGRHAGGLRGTAITGGGFGVSVVVEVTDEAAPWNTGTWRISSGEGCFGLRLSEARRNFGWMRSRWGRSGTASRLPRRWLARDSCR